MTAARTDAARCSNWQAAFLAMLPSIERQAQRVLRSYPSAEREEALQYILASATIAYARLAQLNRTELAYPAPLVRYGLKHYRAGRLIGSGNNCQDVTSPPCQRKHGCAVESLEEWMDVLPERCRTTPAELAALRVDFAEWLQTLSPRNQQLARTLARGEETSAVANLFRLTAGRVSQLRRELYDSWRRFVGETPLARA